MDLLCISPFNDELRWLPMHYCVYSFKQKKDGQTYRDLSTNANYAIITE